MNHELKIAPQYFQAVIEGRKTFEIRKDDRGFQAGDTVRMHELFHRPFGGGFADMSDEFTGRECTAKIGYVTAYEQQPGFVVFSLLDVQEASKGKA